ncbi:MAG: hypothetical protein HY904_02160 [Deltaproteobacteria bacterium]|nr:hypothetical protein [Deltaproteobacteria bacterium]
MFGSSRRDRWLWLGVALLGVVRCSGGTGCSCLAPLEGPFPEDRKSRQVIQARVTPEGFSFIGQKVPTIVGAMVSTDCTGLSGVNCPAAYSCSCPTGQTCQSCAASNPFCTLANPKVCLPTNGQMPAAPTIGLRIPKLGTEEPDPGADEVDEYDVCNSDTFLSWDNCQLYAKIKSATIRPKAGSTTELELTATIDLQTPDRPNGIRIRYEKNPTWLWPQIRCTLYTRLSGNTSLPLTKTVTGTLAVGRDARTDRMTLGVASLDIPIQGSDLAVERESGDEIECAVLDFDFVKDLLVGQLKGQIVDAARNAIDGVLEPLTTQACDPDLTTYQCPRLANGEQTVCVRSDKKCHFASGAQEPIPGLLGMEGSLDLSGAMPDLLTLPGSVQFTTYAGGTRASGTTSVYTAAGGLNVGLVGGAMAPQNPCVAPRNRSTSTIADFTWQSTVAPASGGPALPYHAGFVIHERLMEELLGEAYGGGLLCQELSSRKIGLINSGLIGLLLGEGTTVGELTMESRARPVIMELHPRGIPEAQYGLGTTALDPNDPTRTILDEPLLTLFVPDLDIDMYTLVDDRYIRLITLQLDLRIGLGLEINQQNQVHLIADPVDRWMTNVRVRNADILNQTPEAIAQAVPELLGAFLPQFAPSLDQVFDLPAMSGFVLDQVRFVGQKATGTNTAYDKPRYEFLGIFSNLGFDPTQASAERIVVETRAELAELVLPAPERMHASLGAAREHVAAVLSVDEKGPGGKLLEHSYRVDGGFWRPYRPGAVLRVADPELNLQGWHVVEVRSRLAGIPESLDPTPVEVPVLSDVEPPLLEASRTGRTLEITVVDRVSESERMTVEVTVPGGGSLSIPGAETRTLDLGPEVPEDARLVVTARDQAGHTARVELGRVVPELGPILRPVEDAAPVTDAQGCSGAAAPVEAALALLVLLLRRRHSAR